MKTPPDRAGIIFEIGAQLEARDRHKKWYSATIKKIDYDKERVLVHYQQWNHRHDEWFQWSSPFLRPLERVSLRRQCLNPPYSNPVFASGMKVLACWTDCRFYPAKILSVNRDDSYTVCFYDGVVRTVKPTKVKPFQENSTTEKTAVGSEGWEEGGSEEESVDKQEEEEKEREVEEKAPVAEKGLSDEKGGGTNGEEERKRKAEHASCHSPAKKKGDESRSSRAQNDPIRVDSALPALPNLAHIDRDVLLERQAHLPTTHKFSREPLYRVIKNQPPPILSIELDHNSFKCPASGCTKSFRKASLLHYHIKYYHSDHQVDTCMGEEPPRRRRSSSKRDDFMSGLKSEDQIKTCRRDDRDHSALATDELQKDTDGERAGQDGKGRRNFLRVKLKKKKMKKRKKKRRKSQPGFCSSDDEISEKPLLTLKPSELQNTPSHVDDGSDWSTLTAESGEDTPPWPAGMETEECEVVRCVCEVDEENDFMIQCESCLCWQHGTCMGLYEDNVPHNYICYYCRHFAGWRHAQHFLSEPDLLISGQMFGLSCVKENYSQINASKICHTSRLLGHVQGLTQVLSGLKLQIAMLHSPSSHPDLELWRLPWKREEGALCYVSSEHCYQKPGASWEKPEEAMKVEPNVEQEVVLGADMVGDAPAPLAVEKQTLGCERAPAGTPREEPRTVSVAQCQLNLLEHVEALHHQISSRMDLVERELDVLESWLDHSGELEPPDPLSRLPQLKQRIRTQPASTRGVCPLGTAPPTGGTGQHEGFYKLKVDLLHFPEGAGCSD